jgi:hypothetical protein
LEGCRLFGPPSQLPSQSGRGTAMSPCNDSLTASLRSPTPESLRKAPQPEDIQGHLRPSRHPRKRSLAGSLSSAPTGSTIHRRTRVPSDLHPEPLRTPPCGRRMVGKRVGKTPLTNLPRQTGHPGRLNLSQCVRTAP